MDKHYLNAILKRHADWLANGCEGEDGCANLSGTDLSWANLSGTNLRSADLRSADLRSADLRYANLRYASLRYANLRYANLSGADLRGADLCGADLCGANLSCANLSAADLSSADLSDADLSDADLIGANLIGANLSGAKGLESASDYMESNFERTADGYITYKTFDGQYKHPESWVLEPGNIISENANPCRSDTCGSGINVAPLNWVRNNYKGDIWKVLIRWEWLPGVVVPYNTDGKIRCERVQLLEIVGSYKGGSWH